MELGPNMRVELNLNEHTGNDTISFGPLTSPASSILAEEDR